MGFLDLWKEHKKEQGRTLTNSSLKLLAEEAQTKYQDAEHFGKAVRYSIKNNYQTIIDPGTKENTTPTKYATLD